MSLSPTRFALVGVPNCGKTSLFNALTGYRQKVANYSGVTVEKKEGPLQAVYGRPARIVDLPGVYSLRGNTPDEQVTRNTLLGTDPSEPRPDVLICVMDATHLHLGVRLALELQQTGLPLVLALNMMDRARKQGFLWDLETLSASLGAPVIPIVATRKQGLENLVRQTQDCAAQNSTTARPASETPPDTRALHKQALAILEACQVQAGETHGLSARLDNVLLHPVGGTVALCAVLFFLFQSVFSWAKIPQEALQASFSQLQTFLSLTLPPGPFSQLLSEGILGGVCSVLVFLPQILILFLCLSVLEECGYMARAALLMDRLMRRVGLHGQAFIPLLSSFACAVPGIMATRTIENRWDRLTTILICPLMTCSARLPVYTLLISAFIPHTTWLGFFNLPGLVLFALYAAGSGTGLLVALFLKKRVFRTYRQPFFMVLPPYRFPSYQTLAKALWEKATVFLHRAGTMILALMIILWFLCSYPTAPVGATEPAITFSFAGLLGHWVEPFFAPLGFSWQIAIALLAGITAREVAVATLGAVYAIQASAAGLGLAGLATTIGVQWSLPTALSLLTWYVFAPQCLSTLVVTKKETHSWVWPGVMFLYMFVLAYAASFCVYHLAMFLPRALS